MEIDDIWLRDVRREISEDCQICLFVNKADREEARLSKEERRWCERYNIRYYLVSAKTGRNVTEAIEEVVTELRIVKPRLENDKIIMSLNEYNPEIKKKKCCF